MQAMMDPVLQSSIPSSLCTTVDQDRDSIVSALLQNTISLPQGKQLHLRIRRIGLQHDAFLGNLLISMYSRCGSLQGALSAFDDIGCPTVVSWNSMLTAFCKHGSVLDALCFFENMQHSGVQPDVATFMPLLGICAARAALAEGKRVHQHIVASGLHIDLSLENALIHMYGKCEALHLAVHLFEKMHRRNVVSWTVMIAACVQNGHSADALQLYHHMKQEGMEPDTVTYVTLLSSQESLKSGEELHASIIACGLSSEIIMGNALINMYGKCGALSNAHKVFQCMPMQNVASWNAIITAYSSHEQLNEAMQLFHLMLHNGMKPDNITLSCLLSACSTPAAVVQGTTIHSYIVDTGFELDNRTESALVNMYGKCGLIQEAQAVFDTMHHHDVVSWTAIIASYAQHGLSQESLQLFQQMQQEGIKPNEVTFLCILSACDHAGLVEEALFFFQAMTDIYHITPTLKHYACIIDLLGRTGWLSEAECILSEMPFKADLQLWIILLGACKTYNDVKLAERIVEKIFELDPQNVAVYTLLSNTYAAAKMWDDVGRVRQKMMERGIDTPDGI